MEAEHAIDRRADIMAPVKARIAAREWGRVHIASDNLAPAGMYQPSRLSRIVTRMRRVASGAAS